MDERERPHRHPAAPRRPAQSPPGTPGLGARPRAPRLLAAQGEAEMTAPRRAPGEPASPHTPHSRAAPHLGLPALSEAALQRASSEGPDASPLLSARDEETVLLTDEATPKDRHKTLNIWRLVALAFVFTCSGPFGVEAALRAAGPALGLLGLVLTPVVFVLPQIVMVAELATMIPSNQGYVAWVTRGLGDFWGFINAFSSFAANLLDMSVYCTLFSSYVCVSKLFRGERASAHLVTAAAGNASTSFAVQYAIRLACNLVASSFALLQSKHVAEISTAIGSVVMAPFVIGFLFSARNVRPAEQWLLWQPAVYEVTRNATAAGPALLRCTTRTKRIDWALWGSTLCWLYTGWNSLGNLAAEVRSTSTYTYGMTIATVLDVVAYLISVVAALTVDPLEILERQFSSMDGPVDAAVPLWQDGYLVLAMETLLAGLGSSIAVAAALSIFGILINSITCYARATAGMAELGWLPACLAHTRENTMVPYNSVLLFAVITAVLSLFEFDMLIKVDSLLAAQGYILTFVSFLRLRYSEKETLRPYKVPFGSAGAWATSLMKIGVMIFIMVAVILDSPAIAWLYLGFNVAFALFYVCFVKK